MSDPVTLAREWIEGDPDPVTRDQLQALIDAGETAELAERMAGSLEFGTAGIRGRVEAGSNRMNRAAVIRTTAGLAAYLESQGSGLVVVGRDARLSSEVFMADTVAVLAAAGIPVRYVATPVPTPVIAYAALRLEARAAVVITASHNPPQDNGYKVYDANGAQIVPPVDGDIAAAIAAVGPAAEVPRLKFPYVSDLVAEVEPDLFADYLDDLAAARPASPPPGDLAITYTPMHGVGGRFVVEALAHFGYHQVRPVAEQFDPDGRFPTVAFPNPEEQGALDLAMAQAERDGSDLIIANDPDTDRLAVSVPRPDDGWRPLSGNQVGVLLADYILTHTTEPQPIVINSIVSSPMLAAVAAHHGAGFAQTLTGFKWIWNAALELEAAGEGLFVFGYEEALGYSVSRQVRDKDGISAAVLFADLAADARAAGTTVLGRLMELYRRHGVWVSTQENVVRPGTEGAAEIADAMVAVSTDPPAEAGGHRVVSMTDYTIGADLRPAYLGATPLVELDLGAAGRVLIRPSGTEPKLKVYVDLAGDASDADPATTERRLLERAQVLGRDVVDHLGFA
ncbi:MAG: phospho-sugar mutase [Actinomycetota bacterium]|nr:phospho-sugar mutase [Actinomycetota bacterium]